MAVLLSLAAAASYGLSDFLAGVAGRREDSGSTALIAQPFGLVVAVLGLWLLPWSGPTASSLVWGTASGVGGGLGTLALYRGLAIGNMAVVAPLAGLLSALIPALLGIVLGDRPGAITLAGIAIALPAVVLISWHPGSDSSGVRGVPEGLIAGAGFALLLIGLDRAGTSSGTWPLVPGQAMSVLLVSVATVRGRGRRTRWMRIAAIAVLAGVTGGIAHILFLSATGRGELAVVAVTTSLFPAVTVVLARLLLAEPWTRLQCFGLAAAAVALTLISL
jgi:drug/metabolite transporter (DMT)-like permease